MRNVWAVAGNTFTQCVRTKVAVLFVMILAIALGAMPFIVGGDGTLAGRIQTHLAYSTGIVAVLLGVVTIFLAAGVVASDVRQKYVFTIATKPLARWQYIIGRWLGVVALDALLLALSAGAIYGLAQYLRSGQPLNSEDRRKVETEVFAARIRVSPDPMDEEIKRQVARRIKKLMNVGQYADALEAYRAAAGGDANLAGALLEAEILKQVSESMQSTGPGGSLRWIFSGVEVGGERIRTAGSVRRIDRVRRAMVVKTSPFVLGKLAYAAPVTINGVDGRVANVAAESFEAAFSLEGMQRIEESNPAVGKKVSIVIDPTIQITYKASPAGRPPDNTLGSIWQVLNPQTGFFYQESRRDAASLPATLTVSSRVVDENGRTVVTYLNSSREQDPAATSVTILNDDIAVLYPRGDFTANFVRSILLILMQVMFLAGIAVFAGSFLSFPVACLVCFGILPFSIAREFLADAVSLPKVVQGGADVLAVLAHYVYRAMELLLPDFESTSPGEHLVDGMYVSWGFLGHTAAMTVALRTLLVLVVACVIFRKRELARVQV